MFGKLNPFFLICLIFIAALFSCKKKNDDAKTSTGGPSTTAIVHPYSENKTKYTYNDHLGSVTVDSAAMAIFYDIPWNSTFSMNYVSAGTVTCNDSSVYYDGFIYNSGPPSIVTKQINIKNNVKWTVSGSGTVTPFTYSYTPVYPTYSTGYQLPDTFYKASGLTINLTGITNATGVTVSLYSFTNDIHKDITLPGNSVTFTPAELSSFGMNDNLTIDLYIVNAWNSTQGGVTHGFKTVTRYIKSSYIK